ncbi:hypothetical protein V2J09_016350 [Rumex salicifolius]
MHMDEASILQRRARNLLVKLKLEQNLIDAYSCEGWKGQSREKIRPEKELQRAKTQILRCKLGIRDVIHQLELLSSSGQIDESLIFPDGSVHHDHIYCAKCKLKEASEDNDIILCDGTCNCAFHQKCLDPPLATEDIQEIILYKRIHAMVLHQCILKLPVFYTFSVDHTQVPSGDQGWFCKFCDCKLDILETINAHLGTQFSSNDTWKDIFVEASISNNRTTLINPAEEWPEEDSEDNDYDPLSDETSDHNCTSIGVDKSYDQCSSSSILSLESEAHSASGYIEGNIISTNNSEVDTNAGLNNDEANDDETMSGRRRRYAVDYRKLYDEMFGKDPSLVEQLSEDEDWGPPKRRRKGKQSLDPETKLSELHMEVEETASADPRPIKHLKRIPVDAVEKLRKVFMENELPSREVKKQISQELGLEYEKVDKWFKNARYMSLRTKKVGADLSEDICLKRHLLLVKAKRKVEKKKQEAELLLEKLHQIEMKVLRLKQLLMTLGVDKTNLSTDHVVYIPVAELKEKV